MDSQFLSTEAHVQSMQHRRFHEALMHNQRKTAHAANPTRRAGVVNAIRITVGSMLISAGERVASAPARPSTTGATTATT